MPRFKFSATTLSRYLTMPESGSAKTVCWDTEARGLGAYRGVTGSGTFFVHFRIKGRQRKVTLGRVNELAIGDARARAVEIVAAGRQGRDVIEEQRVVEQARLTLGDAFAEYTKALRQGGFPEDPRA